MLLEALVTGGLVSVLVMAILYDLRELRLPNGLSLALLALFPLHALGFDNLAAVAWQVGLAAAVFAVLFGGFALRLLGGGDVKLIGALALFVPLGQVSLVTLTFAISLLISIAVVLALRAVWRDPPQGWRGLTSHKLPMGLAIGMTGLAVILGGSGLLS